MCYNCGCQEPDDPMGKGKVSEGGASLTEDDLKLIAEKWEMTLKDTKKNILTLLQKTLEDQLDSEGNKRKTIYVIKRFTYSNKRGI